MMDTTQPFTFQCLVDRLYGDYLLHKSLFIAFDFDNTIFDYHNAGRDFHHIIDLLKKCSDHGHKLILFTTTNDKKKIAFARMYCEHFGIKISYVNENPEVSPGCVKPYYNILLDDRAGLQQSYEILYETFLKIIRNETANPQSAESTEK